MCHVAVKVKNQFPYSKIGLSGLTVRHDIGRTVRHDIDVSKKIVHVNKGLGLICAKLNISFIDNSTIDDTCLNKSRLHLNEKGSATLAVHFITFLRGDRVHHLRLGNNGMRIFNTLLYRNLENC